MKNELIDLLPERMEQLKTQLESDYKRWGNTWKKRPEEGQEERIFDDLMDYFDQFVNADQPIPWLKVMGLAHIALVREQYPEMLEEER